MPQAESRVALKNGEEMRLERVEAPCGAWADRIVQFMYVRHPEYTNCSWHHNCARVVAGDFADVSRDVFFVGLLGDQIVGTTWYGTPLDKGDVGTFGRVVTAVEHRRKGISTILSQRALDDFRGLGGEVMHLGTSLLNPAHLVYEAIGYRHHTFIEGNGTIMRAVLKGDYEGCEGRYFAGGQPLTMRALNWGDLARVEFLVNLHHWFLKDHSLRVVGSVPFEGQFLDLMAAAESGETAPALITDEDRLVGFAHTATTGVEGGAQGHVRVVDFLVHPNYAEAAPGLLETVVRERPGVRLLSYASALDVQKCEALEEAGFEREAVLAGVLQDAESEFDLYVYGRE